MNRKLLGFVDIGGRYEPVYAEGRYLNGLPFKNSSEAQGRALHNPWGGTIRDGTADELKLATKTIYARLPKAAGGGFRITYDF